jgi:hypothetical protein
MCSECGPPVDGEECDCEHDVLRCPAGHTWRVDNDDYDDDRDDRDDPLACTQCRRRATGRRCSHHTWGEFTCNCIRDTLVCPAGHAWPAR